MHKNYKLEKQVTTNIIQWHINPSNIKNKTKKTLIIYYTKFKTSNPIVKNNTNSLPPKSFLNQTNVVYKFTCHFRECLLENDKTPNTCIGHTITTFFCRLTCHLSDISAIKLKSSDISKILINNAKIIHKNNNTNRLQFLEAITIIKKTYFK